MCGLVGLLGRTFSSGFMLIALSFALGCNE